MDSFLSDLYRERMEKRAGVELMELFDSIPIEQLERFLGLTKVAVEGPTTPELPDGGPVKKYLDVAEKAPAKKTTPPELPTAASPTAKTAGVVKDLLSAAANRVQKSATPAIDKMVDQQINRKIKDLGPKAMLAGGGLLGGGIATGGVGGYVAGKHSGEKRAELLITALRAVKDAPEYVKHAAAKYVGERL